MTGPQERKSHAVNRQRRQQGEFNIQEATHGHNKPRVAFLFLEALCASVLVSCSFCTALYCQEQPASQEIGAQAGRFKRESEQKQSFGNDKQTKPARIEPPDAKTTPDAGKVSFVLRQVDITGITVFDPKTFIPLSSIYQKYIGKEVTFDDFAPLVEGIKKQYKQKGYYTTIVYIPEQEIRDGRIEVRVVEGRMGKLTIEDNRYFSTALIRKFFHTGPGQVLDFKALQRDILRLNQNSDLEVKAIVSAGSEPQTSDIALKIKDRLPWHIGAGIDNLGTPVIGTLRTSLSLRSSNATGHLDELFTSVLLSSRASGEFLGYRVPVDSYGASIGFEATNFRMKLGKELKSLDISGESSIYSPYISRQLSLSENFSSDITAGLDIVSVRKKRDHAVEANDQLRVPFVGMNMVMTDTLGGAGETRFGPKISFGTEDFLGASSRNHPSASRPGADGFFAKYEHTIRRVQKMPFESYLNLRSQLQLANRTLPPTEQFQLGGVYSVRGYPEGDYLADVGGSMSAEWIFPCYVIPRSWKLARSQVLLRNQIEPLVFVDAGGGRLKKTLPGEEAHKFLLGVGAGFRIRVYNNVFLRLEWAKHLGDEPAGGAGQATFRFALQTEM